MLFVKQECSTIQVCDNILEKPFAGGPAWECPGVAEQSQDLNPLQYSSFVLVQVFVLYLKMCVYIYIYIYTFYILYI